MLDTMSEHQVDHQGICRFLEDPSHENQLNQPGGASNKTHSSNDQCRPMALRTPLCKALNIDSALVHRPLGV